jgi:hypothetical protein
MRDIIASVGTVADPEPRPGPDRGTDLRIAVQATLDSYGAGIR